MIQQFVFQNAKRRIVTIPSHLPQYSFLFGQMHRVIVLTNLVLQGKVFVQTIWGGCDHAQEITAAQECTTPPHDGALSGLGTSNRGPYHVLVADPTLNWVFTGDPTTQGVV